MSFGNSKFTKFLALVSVFGLIKSSCGAMEFNVGSSNNASTSCAEDCTKMWQKLQDKLYESYDYGSAILPRIMWKEMKNISLKLATSNGVKYSKYLVKRHLEYIKCLLENFDYRYGRKGKIENKCRDKLNSLDIKVSQNIKVFDFLSTGLWPRICRDLFAEEVSRMFLDITKKIKETNPKQLLSDYWWPEFGPGRRFYINKPEIRQDLLRIFKNGSSFNPNTQHRIEMVGPAWYGERAILDRISDTLRAYGLPLVDYWNCSKVSVDVSRFNSYLSYLEFAIRNFIDIVNKHNIDKIVFESGMPLKPLKYYSGNNEVKDLTDVEKLPYVPHGDMRFASKEDSDIANYFLGGRDENYLARFNIFLISHALEDFIRQAAILSELTNQVFDYIEITKGKGLNVKMFKNGEKIMERNEEMRYFKNGEQMLHVRADIELPDEKHKLGFLVRLRGYEKLYKNLNEIQILKKIWQC